MVKYPHIAVGTNNPIKIQATREIFTLFFPRCEIIQVKTKSGVPAQPVTQEETIQGAINRARQAQLLGDPGNEVGSIFGVGIEAGLISTPQTRTGFLSVQYTVILSPKGVMTLGASPGFEYPPGVVEGIRTRKYHEISEAMAQLSQDPDIKHTTGAIGFLTRGKMNRLDLTKNGILMALIPFLNEREYLHTQNYEWG